MLVVGSQALLRHFKSAERKPADLDFIATYDEYKEFSTKHRADIRSSQLLNDSHIVVKTHSGKIIEFSLAWEGDSNNDILEYCKDRFATPDVLLMMKLSHRYLRNSPHFRKTMNDIQFLRKQGVVLNKRLRQILKKREAETYVYAHPNLNQSKTNFFDATVDYKYEHDDIHEIVAVGDRPAYTHFQKDGAEVKSCKKKFFELPLEIRLHAGLEESYVLAIERALVPFGKLSVDQSFERALEKVCSSITSGWFREHCWENYDAIRALYSPDYYEKFLKSVDAGQVRLAQKQVMT